MKTGMGDMPTVCEMMEFQLIPVGGREDGVNRRVFALFIAAAEVKAGWFPVFPRSKCQSAQGAVVQVVVAEQVDSVGFLEGGFEPLGRFDRLVGIIEEVIEVVPYKEDRMGGLVAPGDCFGKRGVVMDVTDDEVGALVVHGIIGTWHPGFS